MKGLAGWEQSRIGEASLDDSKPNDADGSYTYDDLHGSREGADNGTADSCDTVPLCAPFGDQAAIEQEANGWAKLWAGGDGYNGCDFGEEVDDLPALTIQGLRDAAMSLPAGTSMGADNISPRAIARLSDGAVGSLIEILHMAEKRVAWPAELNLVFVVLIPERGGGTRPIRLFPTVVRVWIGSWSAASQTMGSRQPELLSVRRRRNGSAESSMGHCVQRRKSQAIRG